MDRILRGANGSIRLTPYDENGDPITGLDVEATITDTAGEVLAGSPFSTVEASGTYILQPGPISALDTYSVAWDLGDETRNTEFEVVGGFMFTLPALRRRYPELDDSDSYSDDDLIDAREQAEELMETHSNVAYRLRGNRVTVKSRGTYGLRMPDPKIHTLVSVTVDDEALGQDDLELLRVDERWLVAPEIWTVDTEITVFYEHGYTSTPEPVRRAAMLLAKRTVVGDPRPEGVLSEVTDVGTIRFATADPGRRRWTGFPDIDMVIARWGVHTA